MADLSEELKREDVRAQVDQLLRNEFPKAKMFKAQVALMARMLAPFCKTEGAVWEKVDLRDFMRQLDAVKQAVEPYQLIMATPQKDEEQPAKRPRTERRLLPAKQEQLDVVLMSLARVVGKSESMAGFSQDLADAKATDAGVEAVIREVEFKVIREMETKELQKSRGLHMVVVPGSEEATPQEAGKFASLKTDVKKLIYNLLAVCIYSSRLECTTGERQLADGGMQSNLFESLMQLNGKLSNAMLRVPFNGPVKAGKSTSINALMAERFSPSDLLPLTVLPLVIRHSRSLECPTLTVPYVRLFKRAAEWVKMTLESPCLDEPANILLGKLQAPCHSNPDLWLLKSAEHDIFKSILRGEFDIDEELQLCDGPSDAYRTVEKLNKLCRICARLQKYLEENLVLPLESLKTLRSDLQRDGKKRRGDHVEEGGSAEEAGENVDDEPKIDEKRGLELVVQLSETLSRGTVASPCQSTQNTILGHSWFVLKTIALDIWWWLPNST